MVKTVSRPTLRVHRDCPFSDHRSDKPPQRNAANARERARMRVLSRAFSRLKTSLPWVPVDTKLSKLDTLRLATTYIAHLRKVLDEEEGEDCREGHPIALTWPFTINNKPGSSENVLNREDSCEPNIRQESLRTNYSSYTPCEYMAKSFPQQYRDHHHSHMNLMEHY